MLSDVKVSCPKCRTEFPLTDAVVATLVEEKVRSEKNALLKTAEKKAAELYLAKLNSVEQELLETTQKLADAEKSELQARRERRTLEDEKRKLSLEIERRLQEECTTIRETVRREEEESFRLKLAERDKVIEMMRTQVEELRRKSDQGSVQLKGEVLELELENMLKLAFPTDRIDPVPTGKNGGDVLQEIISPSGIRCGVILWESKNTRNWSNEWLSKCRDDQRKANAHVCVIVTTALPKDVQTFDRVSGVWVASTTCALPLAKAIRSALINAAMATVAAQGREEKAARMYSYVTGQRFRAHVSAIVEASAALNDGIEAEKRFFNRHWAKQSKHVELLVEGSAAMYGDLQAISGNTLLDVDGLKLQLQGSNDPEAIKTED